jgi:ParB family transcriptional regulator, chromosome partitioning protein
MSTRRSGLGRGLGALITTTPDGGTASAPETAAVERAAADAGADTGAEAGAGSGPPAASVRPATAGAAAADPGARSASAPIVTPSGVRLIELDPTTVARNPRQPREVFDEEEIDQLATSLLDMGMLQPLVVRPLEGTSDGYELVAGERRLRAALVAGLPTVPAIVRATEDADLLKEALVENIHRVQLNPLEEAAAFQQLLEEFGVTQEELAARLGRSRPTISNAIRLLNLPPAVQRRIAAGLISAGHAKVLLSVEGAAAQTRLADRVIAEGLSVRATEEAARLTQLDDTGVVDSPRKGRGRARITVPGLIDLQDDLSDALEARVRIAMGARKGRITIEFLSVDDLERIVGVVADGLASSERAGRTEGGATLPSRPRMRFEDLDLEESDLEGIRRATDLSDLDD